MHDRAVATGTAPLVAKYAENPYLGIVGFAVQASQDEVAASEFMDQMTLLIKETAPETAENVHEDAAVILEVAVRIYNRIGHKPEKLSLPDSPLSNKRETQFEINKP